MQDAMCERASTSLVPRPVFDHFHAIWKIATGTSKLYSNNKQQQQQQQQQK